MELLHVGCGSPALEARAHEASAATDLRQPLLSKTHMQSQELTQRRAEALAQGTKGPAMEA